MGLEVHSDEVYRASVAADRRIERPRPDLGVAVEGEGGSANQEVKGLERGILCRGDLQKAYCIVEHAPGCLLVGLECICPGQ